MNLAINMSKPWDYLVEGRNRKKPHEHEKCLECGKEMSALRSNAKRCSKKCVAQAHYQRLKDERPGVLKKRNDAARERRVNHPSERRETDKKLRARKKNITGRICQSCGLTDGDYKEAGRMFGARTTVCKACTHRKTKWGICITNKHSLPPKPGGKARDYPECLCTSGNIEPDYSDPNNKFPPRIPLKDEDIPEFNYIRAARRKQMGLEMTTGGEGVTRGRKAVSKEKQRRSGKFIPGISGESRKGASRNSPRRSIRGGSSFDIGPRQPKDT